MVDDVCVRCRYCGAVLKLDVVGHYCPTRNCQWQHGVAGCPHGEWKERDKPTPPPWFQREGSGG